nr:unnamed protein product [Timema tahoe]
MFGHKYDDDNSNHSYDSDTNWRTSETWPNNLNTFSQSKISSKKRQTFLGTGTRSCKPVRMISNLLNMSSEATNDCADTAKNSFLPLVQDMSPEKSKDNQESILTWLRQPQVTPSLVPNTGARVVDVAQDVGLTDTPNTGARAAPLYDVAPRLLSRQASDSTDDCCQPKKPLHNSYVTPMKSSHNASTTQSLLCGADLGKTALQDLTNNLPFSKSMPTMVSGQNNQNRRPTMFYQQSDNKENEINTTVMRMSESTPLKNCHYVSEGDNMSALKDQFQLKVYNKSSQFRLPLGTHMPRSVNSGPTEAVLKPVVSSDVLNKDLLVPFGVSEPGPMRGVVNTMSVIQEVYCVKQQTITSSPLLTGTLRPFTKDVGVQCSAQTANAATMTDTPRDTDKEVLCVNGKRYTILNQLGLGGSCVVYQVRDHGSSSVLAVKCVSLPVHDKMLAQGYLNEVSMIRRLQGSESVIKLMDSEHIPERNLLYVVMELGETDFSQLIRDTFRTRGKLSLTMILFYWSEMLTAVKYIHDNEVIHSDLKPSNFLVVKGRLKLIDFGISSSVQCDATSVLKDQAMGTINYMSPEAIVDTQDFSSRAQYRISYRSDVWSLGCILYYMIYGRTPFQHIRQPYAKVAAITDPNSQVQYPPAPRLLTNVVQSCLVFDPKKRPTVADLLSVPFFTWEDSAASEAPTKDHPRN